MDNLELGDPSYIGDYEIISRLGSGSMGVVYKATNYAGMAVAVKVISRHLIKDEKYRQRFLTEAAAAATVPRFCTAPVLDSSLTGERPYIVTEYIPGPTLLVQASEELVTGSALESLAVGIAAALNTIHNAGIVHRDLKPSNIILSSYGPRVIDFGLASILDAARLTSSGNAVGTIAFMSPEQASGELANPKADMYSWAATMVYAGTGKPPSVCVKNGVRTAKFDRDFFVDHRILNEMIQSCLSQDAADRPTSAELVRTLASLAPVTLASAVDHETQSTQAPRPRTAEQCAAKARKSLAEGRYRLALFAAEQGISLDPHHAKCWLHKGVAQVQLGRVEDGEDSLQLAYEMDSNDSEIQSQYSSALVRGTRKEGRTLAFSISPNSPFVRQEFIEHLLREDDDTLWLKSIELTQDVELLKLYRKRIVRRIKGEERELKRSKRRVMLARLDLAESQRHGTPSHQDAAEEELAQANEENVDLSSRLLQMSSQAMLLLSDDPEIRQAYGKILVLQGEDVRDILHGFELARGSADMFDQLVLRCLDSSDSRLTKDVLLSVNLTDAEVLRIVAILHEGGAGAAPRLYRWQSTPHELTARALNTETIATFCLKRLEGMREQRSDDLMRGVKRAQERAFAAEEDNSVVRGFNAVAVMFFVLFLLIGLGLYGLSFVTSLSWPVTLALLTLPLVSLASVGIGRIWTAKRRRIRRRARLLRMTAVQSARVASRGGPNDLNHPRQARPSRSSMVIESFPKEPEDETDAATSPP